MSAALEGRCTCGDVRYRMTSAPLYVHCCHCRWCQRETGSAFALNALIESDRIELLQGATEAVQLPSESGKGQEVHRCPSCRVALWSHYAGAGPAVRFVRVGTLENPDACPPDLHIYTGSKQRWVVIPDDAARVDGYYNPKDYWPADSIARYKALKAKS